MACADDPPVVSVPPSSSTGGGGEAPIQAEILFAEIEPELQERCGDGCHVVGGVADTPFLGDPENDNPPPYDAITSWPGIVVKDASASTLVTWPDSGTHTGGPFPESLREPVMAWLAEEAKSIADVEEEPSPTLPPFKPIVPGFNAVYLSALGPDYDGMAITFQAQELTDSVLSLTELTVHPTVQKGVELEHPLFSVYPKGSAQGDPDPVDSFSNLAQEVTAGGTAPLGPGTLVLTNWSDGARMSIAFAAIDVVDPLIEQGGGGSGPNDGCSALTAFMQNAEGALTQSCAGCHGGGNATASNAVDMTGLGSDSEAACVQIRNRVNLEDPPASQLFITTDPGGNATHPFKFGGDGNAHAAFEAAVTAWITAEAQ